MQRMTFPFSFSLPPFPPVKLIHHFEWEDDSHVWQSITELTSGYKLSHSGKIEFCLSFYNNVHSATLDCQSQPASAEIQSKPTLHNQLYFLNATNTSTISEIFWNVRGEQLIMKCLFSSVFVFVFRSFFQKENKTVTDIKVSVCRI